MAQQAACPQMSAALVKASKKALFGVAPQENPRSSSEPTSLLFPTAEGLQRRSELLSLARVLSAAGGFRQRLWGLSGSSSEERSATTAQPHQTPEEQKKHLSAIQGRDGYLRTSLIYVLAQASHAFMHHLNSTEVHGAEVMQQALARPAGTPLITVCNHVAAMDDPLVLATVVPPPFYNQAGSIRWTLCATDRCFKYAALSPLFTAAKVLPIQRGGGMRQPGMQAAEERLRQGDWVHIFPEGTRSQDGGKMGPVRKGIGKLVAACEQPPLVVPFVHTGMEQIMPRGKALPSVGRKVRVLVGAPIPVDDLLSKARKLRWSDDQLHSAIARRVASHLHALKARLDAGDVAATGAGAGWGRTCGAEPEQGDVSSLDLYDEADLRWHHRASMWEKAKFRMEHRRMLLPGTLEGLGVSRGARRQHQAPPPAAEPAGLAEEGSLSSAVGGVGWKLAASLAAAASAAMPEGGSPRATAAAAAVTSPSWFAGAAPTASAEGALAAYALSRAERVAAMLRTGLPAAAEQQGLPAMAAAF